MKVIGVSDFQDNVRATFERLDEINPDGVVRKEHLLKNGDILFVRSNGNRDLIGRSMYIDNIPQPLTHSAFSIRLRFTSPECHPRFYAYLFRSQLIRQALSLYGGGTNISNLNQDILGRLEVPVPPLAIQEQIAQILSAYDDLIENNTRRIKILEEMAQMIYREWFVNFRFPGHEKVKMVESELGPRPEGWEVSRLSTLVETQYGYTESANDTPVGPKYLRGMDINKTSYIQWASVPYCPISSEEIGAYRLRLDDIVVIRMADPGKVGIIEKEIEAVFASYLIRLKIKNKRLTPYYLFHFLLSDRYQNYVSGASTGTTRKSASAGVITDVDILIPPPGLMQNFEKIVGDMRRMLNNLLDQNSNLGQTRDLLLPKLLSGEISVEHVETQTANQVS